MRGRVFKIKKSIWLALSVVVVSLVFVGLSILSILTGRYNDVFYIFCITTGFHLFVKSLLFKFDSSCYFGLCLLWVGGFYFLCRQLQIENLYPSFILLAFAISSLVTGIFYKEPFQIFLSLSLFFVTLGLLLFLLKIIFMWIFVAFLAFGVLILIIRFFTL